MCCSVKRLLPRRRHAPDEVVEYKISNKKNSSAEESKRIKQVFELWKQEIKFNSTNEKVNVIQL